MKSAVGKSSSPYIRTIYQLIVRYHPMFIDIRTISHMKDFTIEIYEFRCDGLYGTHLHDASDIFS